MIRGDRQSWARGESGRSSSGPEGDAGVRLGVGFVLRSWFVLGVGLLALSACALERPGELLVFSGDSMGTRWSVKVVRSSDPLDADTLEAELGELLRSVDERMSTYDFDSEISRFNRSHSTDWFPVSADTAEVVRLALEMNRRTEGAFDVRVGPLVNLWGFGPEPPPAGAPDEQSIEERRVEVGTGRLECRSSPAAIRMESRERALDLSGIAKGFAVDRLAEHLERSGIGNYLIEVGGELRSGGRRTPRDPWKIGIERPIGGSRQVQSVLALEDQAVATSGDYRNLRIIEGTRHPHVLDPVTGRPVLTQVAATTVICETAAEADAVATAMMVLGPRQGRVIAERESWPVQWIVRDGQGFQVSSTSEFDQFLRDPDAGQFGGYLLAVFGVIALSMLGLASGLLLRGRLLLGGCRGELGTNRPSGSDLEDPGDPDLEDRLCPKCPAPCAPISRAVD